MTTTRESRRPRREFRRRSETVPDERLVAGLLRSGADAAFGPRSDGDELERHVVALGTVDAGVDTNGLVTAQLLRSVGMLWEHGWQPRDLAHAVRKQWSQRVGRLLVEVVAHEALLARAAQRAPQEWLDQLAEVGAQVSRGEAVVAGWWSREGLSAEDGWRDCLRLLGQLTVLPRLEALGPAPSQWGAHRRPPLTDAAAASGAAPEPKVLARIRGLLAKAESTDFPDEADALTAKAQDLMTRHAIDAAVLDAAQPAGTGSGVVARRVHVEQPYASAKVQLLDAVGTANGVRVVWTSSIGAATVVGHPGDLDLSEMLFTSLLVQATRALAEAGRSPGAGSPAFRRAFLFSYAVRIGERLEAAREHARDEATEAYGTDLVPVLARRSEAVDRALEELFPALGRRRRTRVDASGWHAGRAAADRADLSA
ncbi:DUF2786 domain-containing protein [Rhodococcus aerolatus]